MTLKLFDTIGNGQGGAPRDFTVGYYETFRALALPEGGWLAVGKTDTGNHQGQIVAQRISAGGEPVGPEMLLVAEAPGGGGFALSDATFLTNGSLALSFGVARGNTDFSNTPVDVYTRVFASGDFAPVAAAVQVDTDQSDGQQYAGPITALADGGYAIIWRDAYATEGGQQVPSGDGNTYARNSDMRIRTFDADGTPRAAPSLAQGTSGPELAFTQGAFGQDVVGLRDGRIVTVFSDVEVRPFDANGTQQATGNSFHISTATGESAGVADDASVGATFADPGRSEGGLWGDVQVVATPDGGFTIFFAERYTIRGEYGSVAHFDHYLKAQHYTADGAAVGPETVIEYSRDATIGATKAAIALADGGYALAYEKDFGNAAGGADPLVVTLDATLALTGSVRIAPGGADRVLGLAQDADGNLLVTYGGGAPSFVARVVDADAAATVRAGTAAAETLAGSEAADWLSGRGGDDVLQGLGGDDHLYGGAGRDRLDGGAGADLLDGGSGADTLRGGDGSDLYIVDDAADVVIEYNGSGIAQTGYDTVRASVSYRLSANVEALVLTGSDDLSGTGNAGANAMTGNAGDNVLNGAGGADTIDGGAGADTMYGGDGNDVFYVDNAGDRVIEYAGSGTAQTGVDTVVSSVSFALGTNVERLTLTGTADLNATGNAAANILTGNAGANVLNGGGGADTLVGGDGDDTYVVDNAGDAVFEYRGTAGGIDTVLASVSHTLSAGVENLTLTGRNIDGTGNAAANVITGSAGANVIDGGIGADTLTGGAGADTFVFSTPLYSTNIDTITDFAHGTDHVALARGVFAALPTGALTAEAFHTGSAAHDASDRIIYDANTGFLLYDADGSGGGRAIHFATLQPGLAIDSADFVVI